MRAFLLLAALSLCSCHVLLVQTSRCLWEQGVVVEHLDIPSAYRVAPDGTVAFETMVRYGYPRSRPWIQCQTHPWMPTESFIEHHRVFARRKRFVVMSPVMARGTGADEGELRLPVVVDLADPSLRLVPEAFEAADASERLLPDPLAAAPSRNLSTPDDYLAMADSLPEGIGPTGPTILRRRRRWWSYPLQALQPVTVVIDIGANVTAYGMLVAASPIIVPWMALR